MKKKIGFLLFARMSSKRFPGKILKKIKNKTLLEIIYDRINAKFKNHLIIINTSQNSEDNPIVKLCIKKKFLYFRGSLNNVFKRTIDCTKNFELDYFVRVCCDRPIIDTEIMKKMLGHINKNKNFDIITNQFPSSYPRGLACEVAKTEIFKKIKNKNLNKSEKEHIFNFFYTHSKNYKILNMKDSFYKKIEKKNYSIDKIGDLKKFKKIFKKINYNFLLPTKSIIKKISTE